MLHRWLLTVASMSLLLLRPWAFDYCEITCNGTKHTLCAYPVGGGKSCLANEQVYLSLEEKRWILELHNNIRQRVAEGMEGRGLGAEGQPPAGNMLKMVWDSEVAMIAKRWADQCEAPEHDVCRTVMDGHQLGQNSVLGEFQSSDSDNYLERFERIKYLLMAWGGEVENFNKSLVREYNPNVAGNTTHYTQIVWATSAYLGCGYTEFRMPNNLVKFRLICNYITIGNLPFEAVYRPGPPCSSCPPRDNCSKTWNALCWDGSNNLFANQEAFGFKLWSSPLIVSVCLSVVFGLL